MHIEQSIAEIRFKMFLKSSPCSYFSNNNNSEDGLKIISSDCFKVEYTNKSKTTGNVYPEICHVFREIDAYKLIEYWNMQMPKIYQYTLVSITKG